MTREEAIQILSTRDAHGVLCGYTSGVTEALDMAIEALSINKPTDNEINEAYFQGYKKGKSDERQFAKRHPNKSSGEWLEIPNSDFWECSVCGKPNYPTDYCPDCGARMNKQNER